MATCTEGSTCDANVLVECVQDAQGCLTERMTICPAQCVSAGGVAQCDCDDAECAGHAEGDIFCNDSGQVVACTAIAGCLKAAIDDCPARNEVCDDLEDPPVCAGAPPCDDNPACDGMSDGDTTCAGGMVNQCNLGADGCLDLTQENCGAALCDDSGGAPMCGTVTQSGDDCANAIPVLSSTFSLSGGDFVADFADDITVTGTSCNTGAGNDVADAVLSVDLAAGDTVAVTQSDYLYSVVNVQAGTCGGAAACAASAINPNGDPLTFTAASADTYYIIVEPYGTGYNGAYDIEVSVNPDCGNGLLEAGEVCDDGDTTTGDGCTDCQIDFASNCDAQSPTTCQADEDLGAVLVGDVTERVVVSGGVASDVDWYSFTLDTPAQVTVTTTPNAAADTGSLLVVMEGLDDGNFDSDSSTDLNTQMGPDTLRPGQYVLRVEALDALSNGYDLKIAAEAVPTAGAGDTITESGGAVAQFDTDYYSFTITDPVEVTGTLTTGGGDADFDVGYLYRGFTEHDDDGDETINSVLLPGTYLFEVVGYTNVTSYNLDLSLTAANPPDIGTFAAGATIPVTNGGPLTARAYDHHTITFSDDVLLSATLSGNSTGDTSLMLYDADHRPVYSNTVGDEVVTDQLVPAGTYVVQIRTRSAVRGGGDVDAYTLTMSTTAVP